MTANTWYCIAKTNTFDSGCSIKVAFEDYFIQFSARVTYGASAINITRCNLPSSAVFSVRLRESDTQWAIDFYSSIEVTPTITIADSDYWTSVNTSAGAGEVILVINDITSKFNTEQSGGGVGESLFEIMNFGNETEPKYAVVPKNFNGRIVHIYSKGAVASGQPSSDVPTPGGGGGSNVTVTPILTSGEKIATIKVDGVDSDIYAPKKPTYVSELENDAKYVTEDTLADTNTAVAALQTAQTTLRTDFDNLNNLLNDDTSGVIDTWNEVVDFLEGYKESEDLATILSGINAAIADRALKTDLTAVDDRVKTLEALGLTLEVKDGVTYVKSKYSFYTLGGLASGEPSSSGGGGGTVGGSNVSFKAELLSGTKIGTITIDNVATNIYAPSALANPYALTINGTAYDGSSPVDITISGGSGGFNGGTITGETTISTSGWGNQLVINRSEGNGAPAIAFSNVGNGILGYIGIGGTASSIGTKPFYEDASGNTYSLLHSGNYSSYALPLSGGTMVSGAGIYSHLDSVYGAIAFNKDHNAFGSPNVPTKIRSSLNPVYTNGSIEYTLIHSGNIGSQSVDNSAKLVGVPGGQYLYGDFMGAYDVNTIYDFIYKSVAGGSNLPSAVQYGSLLTLPHRRAKGNTIPDFAAQIYIPNGDDSKPYMWFRTSLKSKWNSWRKVVSEEVNGNVLIGTTTDSGYKLHVNGYTNASGYRMSNTSSSYCGLMPNNYITSDGNNNDIWLYNTSVIKIYGSSIELRNNTKVTGNFEATGGVASRQPSDRRLKENICTISTTDAVSVLRKLNPIFFKWNALATSLDSRNTGDSVGFIADEYESLIVNSGRDIWEKYRAIDYTKAIPYLAKGWQINAYNIEDLRTRVEVLERENRELKQRLNMSA